MMGADLQAHVATEAGTEPAAAPPRSYLFVPGDRPERFDKAWDSAADALILDLEDAVAPARKAQAREAVAAWLSPQRPVWIRINAADSPWFDDDLALLARPGVAGAMVPKAEVLPAALTEAAARHGIGLIALVETAQGIARAGALAATPGVVRLAFGSIDFQVDLGIEGDDDALLYFRSQLVLASRLASIAAPIDGVTVAVNDPEPLRHDTRRSRRLGFGAKLCIHPQQIATVHEVLSPSAEERAWADRVIAALKESAGAAVAVDGKMVDRPVLLRAQRIAAQPGAGSTRGNKVGRG
jgi:citrate lyase subunit beta / citryl-CoA lyase